jgi:8-oxo-dGTP pyrophosphatase MutT (NUDIX family)
MGSCEYSHDMHTPIMTTISSSRFSVSIKAVLLTQDARIVLLRNERDEWELPGGRLEVGESPETCLVREIREELGMEAQIGAMLDSYLFEVIPGRHVFIVTYSARLPGAFAPMLSEEHVEIGVFAPGALPENLPSGYRESVCRALSMKH